MATVAGMEIASVSDFVAVLAVVTGSFVVLSLLGVALMMRLLMPRTGIRNSEGL